MSAAMRDASPQVVRFAPALGAWVQGHLIDGHAPDALVDAMQAQGMARDAAQAIVAAFARARRDGTAPPVDVVDPAAGWTVSPLRGHAVYFAYCDGAGEVDHASLHASRAVRRGEKWVATKWMRAQRFVSAGAQAKP